MTMWERGELEGVLRGCYCGELVIERCGGVGGMLAALRGREGWVGVEVEN